MKSRLILAPAERHPTPRYRTRLPVRPRVNRAHVAVLARRKENRIVRSALRPLDVPVHESEVRPAAVPRSRLADTRPAPGVARAARVEGRAERSGVKA